MMCSMRRRELAAIVTKMKSFENLLVETARPRTLTVCMFYFLAVFCQVCSIYDVNLYVVPLIQIFY